MPIKYEFPCYPGDEVWFINRYAGNPLYYGKDFVQMVGFTTRSIRIKLRNHKDFNKTFTWGKNVFATEKEMRKVFDKQAEEANKHKPFCYKQYALHVSNACTDCKYFNECYIDYLSNKGITING